MDCVVRVADRKTETIAVILTELEWMLKDKKKKQRSTTRQHRDADCRKQTLSPALVDKG